MSSTRKTTKHSRAACCNLLEAEAAEAAGAAVAAAEAAALEAAEVVAAEAVEAAVAEVVEGAALEAAAAEVVAAAAVCHGEAASRARSSTRPTLIANTLKNENRARRSSLVLRVPVSALGKPEGANTGAALRRPCGGRNRATVKVERYRITDAESAALAAEG
jgi:hypothetical protein